MLYYGLSKRLLSCLKRSYYRSPVKSLITVFIVGLVLAISFSQFTHRAEAVLTSLGSEGVLNTYTSGQQGATQVAVLPNGNFVTVWESEGEDGNGKGIFARFYNSSGTALGSEIQVNVYTSDDQRNPHVAVSNSTVGITWESRNQFGTGLYGIVRLFDFSGAAASGEIQVSTLGSFQKDFGIAFNPPTGDFVVTWSDLSNIYFQRFSSSGIPQGARVAITTSGALTRIATSVAVNPLNGDFIVVWREANLVFAAGDVYYRRYNASGVAYAPASLLSSSTGNQSNPYITSNRNGNFVAVWDVINLPNVDIYGRRIDASGALVGTEFQVNTIADDTVGVPKVTMDNYANFVVAWSANDGSSDGIYARSFNSSAVAQDVSPILVNTTTASTQNSAGIAINNANVTFVIWSSSVGGFGDIFGRRMDGGFPLPGATIVQSGGTTAITEGGATDSYTVVLNVQPSATVTITADPDAQCDLGAGAGNPITLTFNSASAPLWSTPQTVTVTALDDSLYEGNHTCVITHSATSSDAAYNGVAISSVTANITDNDPQPTLSINDVTVTEGNSGTVNATFTVTLAGSSAVVTTVNVATANDTATAPADFTAIASTPLTFNPGGPLTQTVTVVVNGDTIDEGASEQFFVNLSGATNATITDNQGVGTITDDDNAPVISINDVTVTEGNSGTVNATFTVGLSNGSASVVTVDYVTANDTAAAPSDFTALSSSTLTFNPGGALTQTVTVVVNGDTIDEGANEQFFVNLSGETNATIGDAQGIGTITDDDNAPVISIGDVTVTEGNSGTVNATFTVSLSNGSASVVTVDYATANDTATAPSDFTALGSTTLTFNPGGPLTQTVTVVVNGDNIDEGASEQFFVNLSGETNATIGDAQGIGTITDDDNAPALSINDVTVTEGNSGTVNATFTVSLTSTAPSDITVNYATANDTATAPSDFTALGSTTLTFATGGALSQTVTVVVNGDTIDEGASEQFFVDLSGAVNATITDNQGVGTITDDDNAPAISIDDVTVTEGNSGTVNATFTVSLSNGSASVVTVNYATANDTATAPSDFTALGSTILTFNPGSALSQTVTVVVSGDTIDEGVSEQFFVDLSGAVNATITDNQGVGTITDDDNAPVISIDDVTVTEGNSGTVNATFTVSLSNGSASVVTVDYVTANDTATAPSDFTALSSNTLTFNPGGALSQTVTVVVNGDNIDEGASEQFFVNLSGATNASIGDAQGVGTITDDDSAPTLSINDVTVTEGNSGTVSATFTVSLTSTSAADITVNYATANDTATAPSDYAAIGNTQLTFASGGALSQTVTVVVNGDTIDEGASEQFFVNLSGAVNATLGDAQGIGTITDDDNAPVITINDVTVTEGNSGTVNATFTVSLSNGSSSAVTVNYATANDTATAPSDFTAIASTPLTFNPGGALTQTVTVVVNGDNIDEGASEQFFVNLSGAVNATLGDAQGIGTITDDDNAPVVTINDVTVTEGNSGTVNATFTVSLNSTATSNITLNYATANNTATAPSDFTAINSTVLTFVTGGPLSQTVTVVVNGDTIDEGVSEQFFVNLSGVVNATIGDNQGVGTITDDDNAPVITINDVTVTEGNSGTVNATFTVNLSNGSASVVTVNYATANDTATAPSDYTAIGSTTLTFNPGGALTQTVTVVVNGDTVFEGASERFFVNLSGVTNATVGDAQGIGTITDDDTPRVVITAVSTDTVLVENQQPAPSQRYIFTVNLATSPTGPVTINLGVSNSQIRLGRPGGPYNNTLSLTFVPTGTTPTAPNTLWNVTQTVEVVAVDDTVVEALNQSSQITFVVQAGSAAEYVALTIPAIPVTVVDKDGADALAMSNSTSGQVSLLNTLQDLPAGSAYMTYIPGAPIQGQWVMGDWNDDGIETPGVYGGGAFYYTNNSGSTANWTGIWIGLVGRPAVVGRFSANFGNDCIGAVDSANFPPYGTAFALYFACDLTHGATPALTYQWLSVVLPDSLGYAGAHQFGAGDFNNDGIDSIAIRRGEAVAYTNVPPTTVNSAFDLAQYFGNPGLTGGDIVAGQYGNLVVGDWNNDSIDTFGLFYPAGVMYYRNDQLWNSGVYVRQRMAQSVGASALGTTWHPIGGASAGAGQAETTTQGSAVTPTPTKTSRRQRIESDDAQVTQTGKWTVQSAPAASGGRYVYSTASTDDILTLKFEGTSVEIIYLEGPSIGSFTVVVDDVAVRTVIATQNATAFNRSTLINYLSDGPHTVQIVPIRGVIAIDAFIANSAE